MLSDDCGSESPGIGVAPSFPGSRFSPSTPGAVGEIPGLLKPTGVEVEQMDFVLQFVWKPTPLEERPMTDPALEPSPDQPQE